MPRSAHRSPRRAVAPWAVLTAAVAMAAGLGPGCGIDLVRTGGGGGDLGMHFEDPDGGAAFVDGAPFGALPLGPPFVLRSADLSAREVGLVVDASGGLTFSTARPDLNVAWIANAQDFSIGTVSKVSTRTVRELARYRSTTCFSLPGGSARPCDDSGGCCAVDSDQRLQARVGKVAEPARLQVPLTQNLPSRTTVDVNGDVLVANRGSGNQASLTRIANSLADCLDRNHNGRIDTSSDGNGDGVINTDCNHDGAPDDLASVQARACVNGLKQEFYGGDDECVLWTTLVGSGGRSAIALALGPGQGGGPGDAWVGTRSDGLFRRVDGITGLQESMLQLPGGCHPLGVALDSHGVLWVPTDDANPLCYAPTDRPLDGGAARNPGGVPFVARTASVDRDGNVWLTDATAVPPTVWRYTPDRSAGNAGLGQGHWIRFHHLGGGKQGVPATGIALDTRTPTSYFGWVGFPGGLVQLPASTYPSYKFDSVVDGSSFPWNALPGFTVTGVGVAVDGSVVLGSSLPSAAIRCPADIKAVVPACDVISPAKQQNVCPAGDRCELKGPNPTDPEPAAYSDFVGVAGRAATIAHGSYSRVVSACGSGAAASWRWVSWDIDLPPGASVSVRARAGNTVIPDGSWTDWTETAGTAPLDLAGAPEMKQSMYLEVELLIDGPAPPAPAPLLRSAEVAFECVGD